MPFINGRWVPKRLENTSAPELDAALKREGIGLMRQDPPADPGGYVSAAQATLPSGEVRGVDPRVRMPASPDVVERNIVTLLPGRDSAQQTQSASPAASPQAAPAEAEAALTPEPPPEQFTGPRATVPGQMRRERVAAGKPALPLSVKQLVQQASPTAQLRDTRKKEIASTLTPEMTESAGNKLNNGEAISAYVYEQLKPALEKSMAGRAMIQRHEAKAGEIETKIDAALAAGGQGLAEVLSEGTSIVSDYASRYLTKLSQERDEDGKLVHPKVAGIVQVAMKQEALQAEAARRNAEAGEELYTVSGGTVSAANPEAAAKIDEINRIADVRVKRDVQYSKDGDGFAAFAAREFDMSPEETREAYLSGSEEYRAYTASAGFKLNGGIIVKENGEITNIPPAKGEERVALKKELRDQETFDATIGTLPVHPNFKNKLTTPPVQEAAAVLEGVERAPDGEPSLVGTPGGLDAIHINAVDDFLDPEIDKSLAELIKEGMVEAGSFKEEDLQEVFAEQYSRAQHEIDVRNQDALKRLQDSNLADMEPTITSMTELAAGAAAAIPKSTEWMRRDAEGNIVPYTPQELIQLARESVTPLSAPPEDMVVLDVFLDMLQKDEADQRVPETVRKQYQRVLSSFEQAQALAVEAQSLSKRERDEGKRQKEEDERNRLKEWAETAKANDQFLRTYRDEKGDVKPLFVPDTDEGKRLAAEYVANPLERPAIEADIQQHTEFVFDSARRRDSMLQLLDDGYGWERAAWREGETALEDRPTPGFRTSLEDLDPIEQDAIFAGMLESIGQVGMTEGVQAGLRLEDSRQVERRIREMRRANLPKIEAEIEKERTEVQTMYDEISAATKREKPGIVAGYTQEQTKDMNDWVARHKNDPNVGNVVKRMVEIGVLDEVNTSWAMEIANNDEMKKHPVWKAKPFLNAPSDVDI